MQDNFARARTRPKGQARATIGYLVYKKDATCIKLLMDTMPNSCSFWLINVIYHYSRASGIAFPKLLNL